jgi:hypothetical protein
MATYGVKQGSEVWYNGKCYLHEPAEVIKVLADGSAKIRTADGQNHDLPKIESSMQVDAKSKEGVADILHVSQDPHTST